jgi:lysophospholipase L1-like esterase
VAMGSSFAAGPGLPSRVPGSPRRAGRSTGNYAHLLAGPLGLDLHDVTFSGATTGDLLRPSAAGQPAQLDAVTADTALVTITAGGNDVGYVPRLTLASLPWPLRALPGVRARIAALGDSRAADERFAQLENNLAAIAARLRERAPGCPGARRRLPHDPAAGRRRPARATARRHRPVGPRHRGPALGRDAGGRHSGRLAVRGRVGRLCRPPCLVSRAMDAALSPVAAGRSAVPPQRDRDGRGGRPPDHGPDPTAVSRTAAPQRPASMGAWLVLAVPGACPLLRQ